jgi:Mn2+/Fe2+ NRAMP family transporter
MCTTDNLNLQVDAHFVLPNVQFVVPVCCLCCKYGIATGEGKVRKTRNAYGRKPYSLMIRIKCVFNKTE